MLLSLISKRYVFTSRTISAPARRTGPVPVRREGARGTVVVEGRLEAHAGADARALDLALRVDLRRDRVPRQHRRGPVGHGVDPAAVDRPGHRVGVDRGGGRLEVGVVPVQELVPEARPGLAGGEPADVRAQEVEDRRPVRVVLGQHVEQLDERHEGPAVRPGPAELGVDLHPLHPAVHEEPLLAVEHPAGELQDLLHRVVVVPPLAGELPHLRERGHAHVEVVEPERVRLRPVAGQRPVGQPELLRADEADEVVDHRPEVRGDARARGLDHRRAQRARVVERARLQHRAEGTVRDGVRPVVVGERGDESEAPGHVVLEGRVARRLRGEQHAGVHDAPLVARHAEGPGLDDGLGAGLREVGEGLAGRAVHDPGRRLSPRGSRGRAGAPR